MDLEEHPGFLGCTSHGVIAIHADWPVYPAGHGIEESLWSLGQFPQQSVFSRIDNIDGCWLYVLADATTKADPFSDTRFHVALWEEDVNDLFEGAFVASNGSDDWFAEAARLRLTTAGWREVDTLASSERVVLHSLILERAVPIADIGHYDAAVREACVALESVLREIVGSRKYGQPLIEEFIAALPTPPFIAAYNKVMRSDLRSAFKFIRNDYAHNLRVIDGTQCRVVLARLSVVFDSVEAAKQTLTRERQDKRSRDSQ